MKKRTIRGAERFGHCSFLIQKAELGGSHSLVRHHVEHDGLRRGGRVRRDAGRASLPAAGQRGRDVPRGRLRPQGRPTEIRSDSKLA